MTDFEQHCILLKGFLKMTTFYWLSALLRGTLSLETQFGKGNFALCNKNLVTLTYLSITIIDSLYLTTIYIFDNDELTQYKFIMNLFCLL